MSANRGSLRDYMLYYSKCMIGGAWACGFTHTGIVTLDVVKCRRQVDKNFANSLMEGIQKIRRTEGVRGLTLGWAATFVGYNLQGIGKFGFYEIFKDFYARTVGDNVQKYRYIGYTLSSACAEVIADLLLCPWESLKVRTQTSKLGTFPTTFWKGFTKIRSEEGA